MVNDVIPVGGQFSGRISMTITEPKNTTRVIRDTFFDMTLYLEAIFLLHSVNDVLVEDIITCMEEGYTKAMKNLKKMNGTKTKTRRKSAVDRFIKKLEQEKI
jgi:hypothetical protein